MRPICHLHPFECTNTTPSFLMLKSAMLSSGTFFSPIDTMNEYILLLVQICKLYKYKGKSTNTVKRHFPTVTTQCIHEAICILCTFPNVKCQSLALLQSYDCALKVIQMEHKPKSESGNSDDNACLFHSSSSCDKFQSIFFYKRKIKIELGPLQILSKFYDVPFGFCFSYRLICPPPLFEALSCFVHDRRRAAASRHWIICLVLVTPPHLLNKCLDISGHRRVAVTRH